MGVSEVTIIGVGDNDREPALSNKNAHKTDCNHTGDDTMTARKVIHVVLGILVLILGTLDLVALMATCCRTLKTEVDREGAFMGALDGIHVTPFRFATWDITGATLNLLVTPNRYRHAKKSGDVGHVKAVDGHLFRTFPSNGTTPKSEAEDRGFHAVSI